MYAPAKSLTFFPSHPARPAKKHSMPPNPDPDAEADNVADPSQCAPTAPAPAPPTRAPLAPADPTAEWPDTAFAPLRRAAVATIPYTPRFAGTFGLLGAARRAGEVSERALRLCGAAIRACPADFNAWAYRMDVVRGLVAAAAAEEGRRERLRGEREFVREVAAEAGKGYQVWEYRRFLVELGRGVEGEEEEEDEEEFELVDDVLDGDEKNYHAWSHRTWLMGGGGRVGVAAKKKEEEELLWSGLRIRRDVRNNSAYAYRWAVAGAASRGVAEMRWALDRMRLAPRNEAAWNYVLALARHVEAAAAVAAEAAREEVRVDAGNVPARRFLVLAEGDGVGAVEEKVEHCRVLATEVDVQRGRYWMWKMGRLNGAGGVAKDG